MNQRRGLTLAEVVFVIAALALIAWLVVPALRRRAAESRRAMCGRNLNQLAKSMATYLNEHDDNCLYPCPLGRGAKANDYNGAEWLAGLYWTGVIPDPGVFLCPGSGDHNRDGKDIGTERAPAAFGSQTVSYAGMHYGSITGADGERIAVRDDFPPDEPMASDDTQGAINHGHSSYGGMNVLFFDSHVEFRSRDELDPRTAVGATTPRGQPRPLLWRLRN